MRLIVFTLLAAASFSAAAGSVDINLSNDTIEAKFYGNAGAADWTFGGLYNRDSKDRALNVGLLATGDSAIGNSRFEGGLGGKIYSVTVGSGDLVALALGGQVRWFPGNGSFALATYVFYAPHVVTLVDGQRFFDAGVRAEVEVIRNSFVYVGYRQMQAELDNNVKLNVDKGGFVGLQIKF
ncbi:MAG TPA: YfaZ family outer membrane protein [Burkholderiales bacterium]|nr:YfaZ family outer membrane protein [Burkholderiales bacterium]